MTEPTTAAYDGTVERTADGGVIRYERRLPYAVADVWDAVTNPERLADWWLPFDADITIDLREGGEMVMTAVGGDPTITCTILKVDAPVLLEHTHADPGSVLRWELEAVDGGCLLRLSHFVTDVDVAIDRCFLVGLHESLARLEPLLAGQPVPWDWDRFAAAQAAYAELGFAPPVAPPVAPAEEP
jgi:uncharacterized protein YndB with AHSA1/START domain